jgi:hypothetical protein
MMQIIECPICLQPVKNTITTHCNHTSCDLCIINHLMIRNTCPICRGVCNYNQIVNQIKPNREKILIKKLYEQSVILHSKNAVLQGQNPDLQAQNQGQNPDLQAQNPLTNYHMPPMPSFVITIFIVEVSIIICMIFYIVQKVNYIYNQENK